MITVNSVVERREAVTAINDYDTRTGGLKSQRAKYEKPLWWYILALLNGQNNQYAHSVENIVEDLKYHNIVVSQASVYRALAIMSDTAHQIHPNRRGCGISCHTAVKLLGGIKTTSYVAGTGRPLQMFYLGSVQSRVDYNRRAWNMKIN